LSIAGGTVQIRFASKSGVRYTLQTAVSLGAPTAWTDAGAPVSGTGAELMLSEPIGGSSKFYRVSAQ